MSFEILKNTNSSQLSRLNWYRNVLQNNSIIDLIFLNLIQSLTVNQSDFITKYIKQLEIQKD